MEKNKAEARFDLYYDKHLSRLNYDDKLTKTLNEWHRFLNGEQTIDASVIPTYILESWKRCRNHGVDPSRGFVHDLLPDSELDCCLEDNKFLIECSLPIMRNLHSFVKGSGMLVTLCDRRGVVIGLVGDDPVIEHTRRYNYLVGARWLEREAGTNCVGTLVELKRPFQIFAGQHYCKMYHMQTTSSSPIFNEENEFVGGIIVAGRYYKSTPHTLGMAVAASHAVGNELRMKKALKQLYISDTFKKTVISSVPEALIAINQEGFISLANENADKMFPQDGSEMEGRHILSVLGNENKKVLRMINQNIAVSDFEVRIRSNNKVNDFSLTANRISTPDGEHIGNILIINELKRVKTLVNKMIGAKANFAFDDICGVSPKYLEIINQARMASRSNSTVLLLGKSGTGKDVIAQSIHNASSRRREPYLAINCAAIPRDLVASELFGFTEGAFTGSRRGGGQGKFELADGGTIFLDEIAEISLELQPVLLRVIEDKAITRIGGTQIRPVDVRIIAATNKDLKEEVAKGNFREDLFYRLNVFTIHIIPLAERREDIPLLIDLFVSKTAKAMGKVINKIDKKIYEIFANYAWPGNVRELQNTIERMINYVESDELSADLIPKEITQRQRSFDIQSEFGSIKDIEYKMLLNMLDKNLSKKEIAKRMKISRTTLYRKLERFELI